MKLKYKILWIEDEKSSIKIKARNIRRYLEDDYGFECKIEDMRVLDYEEFLEIYVVDNRIKEDSDIEQFDLLLVDFNLGEKEHTGDKLIQIIRDDNIYSEILFYSSDLDSLIKKLNQHFIDGVFTSVRDELENKVKKLIKVTIKKVQDVNNLRGLIMAEVAELDRIKKSILLKYNAKNQDDIKLKKYVKEDIFKKINDELVDLECVINSSCEHSKIDIEKLLNNFFYDSYKKSRTVFKVKKLDSNCSDIPFIHQEYFDKVIKKRNVLAHESEHTREDGSKYLNYTNGKPLEFTEEHCIEIRQDIRKYKKLLEDIDSKMEES